MEPNVPADIGAKAAGSLSFNQKWEMHKPLLERLYLQENLKLPKIKGILRDEHNFDVEVHQYKYRFDKWNWKKSINSKTKARIVSKSRQRLEAGRNTIVMYKGRAIDSRKLIRSEKLATKNETLATLFRREGDGVNGAFPLNGVAGNTMAFVNWNLPYRALLRLFPQLKDHKSPAAMSASTPSDVSIASPAAEALSPGLSQSISIRKTRENAALFIAGDFEGLLRSFSERDRKVFSTWMHEFWYFSFMTAKHWGSRLGQFTADDLWQEFSNAVSPNLLAPTPPGAVHSPQPGSLQSESHGTTPPSSLCRWSIHVEEEYQWVDQQESTDLRGVFSDIRPQDDLAEPLQQKLQQGLESNSFSTVPISQLPVDLSLVGRAARKSPDQMWEESFGFAIMSGNYELVETMMQAERDSLRRRLQNIRPAHLAAAYLNGGKSCCLIIRKLCLNAQHYEREASDRDDNGRTVLDILMLRILRSHSTTQLDIISDGLRRVQIPVGEEVDVCGRWDPETPSYRELIGGGMGKVPKSWKHRFCHTSIQAICHSIGYVSQLRFQTLQTSGLFASRCFHCGLLLEVSPLTALVFTTWHLLKESMDSEDLFGMVYCLFQLLLSLGEYVVFLRSPVCTRWFDDDMDRENCNHEELSPWEVAMRLNVKARQVGSPEACKGWEAFLLILGQVEEQHRWVSEACPPVGYEKQHEEILRAYENDSDDDIDENTVDVTDIAQYSLHREVFFDGDMAFPVGCEEHGGFRAFGRNLCLGHIWAACQVELLTYRRQKEGDPWTSQHLTIDTILECLRTGDPEVLPYVGKRMLETYCACGCYQGWFDVGTPREYACCSYFSNLDDWHRTSFIPYIR
ncbi:hypothetical protein K491DRAFT_763107 [Lophiostoma macrostomum CBS 122681]|uniref:Clr5 domain-containing protein n=1 Tax=Lophiostoma macrostomum CBS 122681 TaxID=1314788 RepID=A0A6A6SLR8_9PLEO|nr:hypothetical protein K491DRAFT_763107 [Lophiostoma macrostomum CBS 122681]